MVADFQLLTTSTSFDAARVADQLRLIHADTPGTSLEMPAGTWSLWLPLRHELRMRSAYGPWRLPRRHVALTRDAAHGHSEQAGSWLVLAGSHNAWSAGLRTIASQATGWLPMQATYERGVIRSFVHLARLLRDGSDASTCEAAMRALLAGLLEQQRVLHRLLDRCNGRTPQRRHATLQRLLRVHQLIERSGGSHLGLAQLAGVANYSPWHLIRMYRDVFGETPSEHAARLRLARAWSLVRESELPVCEITERLGFESQSAFCRAFKSAYGLTTTQARHLPAASSRQVSPRPVHARPRTRHAPPLPSARRR